MNLQQKEQLLSLVALPVSGAMLTTDEMRQLRVLWSDLQLEVLMEKRQLGMLTHAESTLLASIAKSMLDQALLSKDEKREKQARA